MTSVEEFHTQAMKTFYFYGWEPYIWYGYRHPTLPVLQLRILIECTFVIVDDIVEEWFHIPVFNAICKGDFRDALWFMMAQNAEADLIRDIRLEQYYYIPGCKRPIANVEFNVPLAICKPHPRIAYLPNN
jgi:hypothetical protein